MRQKRKVFYALLATLLVLFSHTARASEYRSEKGYRMDYPDAWQVANQEHRQMVGEAAKQLLANVDLSRMDVMVYNPQSYPVQTANVIVAPGSIPRSNSDLASYKSALLSQFTSSKIAIENLDCKFTHIGDNDGILATWTAASPAFGPQKMQQRQFIVAGRDAAYIITCSAGISNAAQGEQAFSQILSSFHVDHKPFALQDFWNGSSGMVRGAIIGGTIGGLIGLIKWATSRSKSSRNNASPA